MDIATTVLNVLRTAGELAIEHQPSVSVCHKEDGSVITQADLDVTELVKKSLSDFLLLPNHMFVDEESFSTLGCCSGLSDVEYTWVLDPVVGDEMLCESEAFFEIYLGVLKHGMPWIGGVYLPVLKELYFCDGKASFAIRAPFSAEEQWGKLIAPKLRPNNETFLLGASRRVSSVLCTMFDPMCAGMLTCWPLSGSCLESNPVPMPSDYGRYIGTTILG